MKSEELRYILVKNGSGGLGAFVSLMPCFEEGEPVVYCYEIHLKPELRRYARDPLPPHAFSTRLTACLGAALRSS